MHNCQQSSQQSFQQPPKKTIGVVSGSRADAGLLFGLMHQINRHPELKLQVFVTGMHLSQRYGNTWQEFEQKNIPITEKIAIPLADSSELDNCRAIGTGVIQFGQCLSQHQPDLLLVLGDRFEILAAVQSAMMLNIPIAHLHGGELSLGSIDDRIRHAITKMSQLHFPSTEVYAKRIIQMGESPKNVFNVGATAIDNIFNTPLIAKNDLQSQLGISFERPLILATWHPETSEPQYTLEGLKNILAVLKKYPGYDKIITKANADSGGDEINRYLTQFVSGKTDFFLFDSLGNQRYLSLLHFSRVVIGNSSSALYEVAAMRVASVNIGSRQNGRYKPDSVIDCSRNLNDIDRALTQALSASHQEKCQCMKLPYGNGDTAKKIVNIIAGVNCQQLLHKPFFDIEYI